MSFYMRAPSYTPDDPVKSVKQLHSWLFQLNENLKYLFNNLDEENFTDAFLSSITGSGKKAPDPFSEEASTLPEWEPISVINSYSWGDNMPPRILKIGHAVYLAGGVKLKSSLSHRGWVQIGILPEKYRPRHRRAFAVHSDAGLVRMDITPSGSLELKNMSGTTISPSAYIAIMHSYVV